MGPWTISRRPAGELEAVRCWLVGVTADQLHARLSSGQDACRPADCCLRFERDDFSFLVVEGEQRLLLCAANGVGNEQVLEFVQWLATLVGAEDLAHAQVGAPRDVEFSDLFGEGNVLLDLESGRAWPLLPTKVAS